jgi:hypothetical protein
MSSAPLLSDSLFSNPFLRFPILFSIIEDERQNFYAMQQGKVVHVHCLNANEGVAA